MDLDIFYWKKFPIFYQLYQLDDFKNFIKIQSAETSTLGVWKNLSIDLYKNNLLSFT